MLTFNVVLRYYAGPPIPRLLVIFVFVFFFQSDRPIQYQETHSKLKEKKKGWPWHL